MQLLRHLKVGAVSRGQFYRQDLLPRASTLFASHPQELMEALQSLLLELSKLSKEDSLLMDYMKTCPFVPAPVDGIISTSLTLRKANELYDPQEQELLSLLSPEKFPSPSFLKDAAGDTQNNSAYLPLLSALRSLGMRSNLDWAGVLDCARSIANMTEENEIQRSAKKFRGDQLLSFLNRRIAELMGEDMFDLSGGEEEKTKGGKNSSSFSSLFGIKNMMSLGANKALDQQRQQKQREINSANLQELLSISWLPALVDSPDPLMPWPRITSHEECDESLIQTFKLPLSCCAAPNECVALSEAWLASFSKRILDSALETSVSNRLKQVFGWTKQQFPQLSADSPKTAAVSESRIGLLTLTLQLKELARIYEELVNDSTSTSQEGNENEKLLDPGSAQRLQRAREIVTGLIPQIYQQMNNALQGHKSPVEVQRVISVLHGRAWLWMGDRFVGMESVALNAAITAAPYLYQLPQDLQA